MASKLVNAVAAINLPHAYSPLGHVTVSLGVVSLLPGADNTAHSLLQRADAALYQAKKQGRNQVSVDLG
jgi:diguanylate cyclase (GGDEF)-like protein